MGYSNPQELLTAAAALPEAIEEKLPSGAPKVSTMLTDVASNMSSLPDFPMELPALPAVPELPEFSTSSLGRRTVTSATVTPLGKNNKTKNNTRAKAYKILT